MHCQHRQSALIKASHTVFIKHNSLLKLQLLLLFMATSAAENGSKL